MRRNSSVSSRSDSNEKKDMEPLPEEGVAEVDGVAANETTFVSTRIRTSNKTRQTPNNSLKNRNLSNSSWKKQKWSCTTNCKVLTRARSW